MYELTSGKYIDELKTVDNQFIKQVYMLALGSAKNNKMVSVVTKDFMSNRGEIASKQKNIGEKSIIDLAKLTPLMGTVGAVNLQEEVAKFRWDSLQLQDGQADFWKENPKILFLDYLLAASLCYIEVFDKKSAKVDKFFATRNRLIAGTIAGVEQKETVKYNNYLSPKFEDYKFEQLRVLKLSQNKTGFKITQPRSAIDFKKNAVRITPLFLLTAFLTGISATMKDKMLKFKFIKDNGQEREVVATLSPTILMKYYDSEYTQKVLNGCEIKINRGYIKVPEVGCSKYDETGVRSLNLARITSIEEAVEVDTEYINVDFSSILPTFKIGLEEIKDISILKILYEDLVKEAPKSEELAVIKADMNAFVDSQNAIYTTVFQRELHKFMLKFSIMFKNYTGKPIEYGTDAVSDNFNLGVM